MLLLLFNLIRSTEAWRSRMREGEPDGRRASWRASCGSEGRVVVGEGVAPGLFAARWHVSRRSCFCGLVSHLPPPGDTPTEFGPGGS